ncbi:c-type cytochrome [Marinobacter adhaerens]|uniref:C-type cytochrome n=1 Tax=Marinobacter adhaerens TaxID=1033846 RepID=A0A851HQA0_9GAMM|nr:c-type cytochrome [Marinobacter adhaerens]NWN91909.1 c-type cytochrome [Marinobacter adhaerens]
MNTHDNNQHKPIATRIIYSILGAVVLFIIGTLLYRYEVLAILTDSYSEPSASQQESEAVQQARRKLAEEREQWDTDVTATPPAQPTSRRGYYAPPAVSDIPDNEFGESVKRGREIFVNTGTNAGEFVGNDLACANCHLDSGRLEHSAPMWAAAVSYPAYRGKNERINTMEDRVNGCFTYSMNAQHSEYGAAPPPGHQVYKDLESYFYWMADGLALKSSPPGQGYPTPPETDLGYDRKRGKQVYADNCAVCHATDGQGRKDLNGRYIFPPLWGPDSFNWGAGMHRVNTAAGFIQANMPLGKRFSLSDQEAWDVAAYVMSFPRPADPRLSQTEGVDETTDRFHQHMDYHGQTVRGMKLGEPLTEASWSAFMEENFGQQVR